MKRGAAEQRTHRKQSGWTTLGSFTALATLVACGGRTGTDDRSLLDDSSLVGTGEVLDVTNPAATVPGSGTNPPGVIGTGSTGTTPPSPTQPRPTPPGPPRPVPMPTAPVPTAPATTSNPTTIEPSPTSDVPTLDLPTSEDWTTSEPWTTTTEPTTTTTNPTTSEPDPTTSDVTSEPPIPFDPLHPPDGQVPLGLPAEYADVQWFDTDKCFENYGWANTSQCYAYHSCDQGNTRVDCSKLSSGDWACSCYDFDYYSYYSINVPGGIVSSDDPRQACRVGSAICLTDVPPTEEPDCSDVESSSLNSCSVQRTCSERWESSYGEFSLGGQQGSVYCNASDDPSVAACWCEAPAGYLSFEMTSGLADACNAGIDVCFQGVAADSLQPVECSWYQSNSGNSWCEQYYDCEQRGLSEGVEVVGSGQVNVSCYQNEDSSWNCGCSDGSSVSIPVEGASPAVCDTAAQDCIGKTSNLFERH